MEIKQVKHLEVNDIAGEFESTKSQIKESSMGFVMGLLSKSMYSNPIGSIVREITSNCFDSHTEAKVNDPVIIKKGEDEEGIYISFNDYGVGLSPDRISSIFINYGESTKRDSNDLIGGFGLGSKSPLSYTDAFYIITNFDSIKYTYVFSKGESVPTLDLLTKEDTTERNGTEIRIHIKNKNDEEKFRTELNSQLAYFDNVYFIGWSINNEYRIYEGKYFKFRDVNQYSSRMHILLGKVAYPIDWDAIEMTPLDIAVGVKFVIGELEVTPNRENLRYTEETIPLVQERVKQTLDELIEIYKSQNVPYESFKEWYLNQDTRPGITFAPPEGKPAILYLNNVKELSKAQRYKYFKHLKYLYSFNFFSRLYDFAFRLEDSKVINHTNENTATNILGGRRVLLTTNKVTSEVKNYHWKNGYAYKRDTPSFPRGSNTNRLPKEVFISSPKSSKVGYKVEDYKFGGGTTHFHLGASMILYTAIKKIREEVEVNFVDYNTIPGSAYEEYKEFKRSKDKNLQRKLQGKVFVKSVSQGNDYEWKLEDETKRVRLNPKSTTDSRLKTVVTIHGINSYRGIVVYGNRDNIEQLNKAEDFLLHFSTLRSKASNGQLSDWLDPSKAKVILISKQNEKYFKDNPNMVHVDNLYSDHKLFRRLASAYKIEEFFKNYLRYQSLDADQFVKEITKICSGVGDSLKLLLRYRNKYFRDSRNGGIGNHSELKTEVLSVAQTHNLFDPVIETIFEKVNAWFDGVEILKYTDINENSLPYILTFLREKKKKLNYEYYCIYAPEAKERIKRDKEAQYIIMFQEEQEEKPKTKFQSLTKNVA